MAMKKDFGAFEVHEKIGAGGMAGVYIGRQKSLDRKVVLKILYPHLAEDEKLVVRFEREARAAALLRHENIVQIIDCGRFDDVAYIAMEFVEGMDLKEWTAAHGAPPVEMGLLILRDLFAGLEHAHAHRIVHRDIKPANLMLTPDGVIKVMDFGLARRDEDSTGLTVVGSVMGTPAYMSPEQATGEAVDERSDIFSAGVVAYELLGGAKPFEGENYTTIIRSILTVEPKPLETLNPLVPAEVMGIVQKMLQKDASRRYPHISQARGELENVIEQMGLIRSRDLLREYAQDPKSVIETLRRKRLSKHLDQGVYFETMGLGKIDDALLEFRRVLHLEPGNKTAQEHVKKLERERVKMASTAPVAVHETVVVPVASGAPAGNGGGTNGGTATVETPARGTPVTPASRLPGASAPKPPAATPPPKKPVPPPKAGKPAAAAPAPKPRPVAKPGAPGNQRMMLIGVAVALVVVVGALIGVVASRGKRTATPVPGQTKTAPGTNDGGAAGPQLAGGQTSAGQSNPMLAQPPAAAPSGAPPEAAPDANPAGPAVPPPQELMSSLDITSVPPGASVWIDGKKLGVTPGAFKVSAGKHRVRLGRKGSIPQDVPVADFIPNTPQKVNVTLTDAPAGSDVVGPGSGEGPVGTVTINVEPSATFLVDGKPMGGTGPSTSLILKPGHYVVRAENPQYGVQEWPVDVKADGLIQLEHDFVAASAGAVHVSWGKDAAKVFLDGADTGKSTPCDLRVPPGNHTVMLQRDGYESQTQSANLKPRESVNLKFKLKKKR